jgi:hypothetical protein
MIDCEPLFESTLPRPPRARKGGARAQQQRASSSAPIAREPAAAWEKHTDNHHEGRGRADAAGAAAAES